MDVLRESWDEERGELEAVIDAKEEMVAQLKESLQARPLNLEVRQAYNVFSDV